jgi:L-ascorbate metabolism protein UlaG (beta-lactamase superfamily)
MDIQFYGANCLSLTYKGARIVIDDNLTSLGAKSIIKAEDVALYTGSRIDSAARLTFDGPGEYEVSEISVIGIPARAHMDEVSQSTVTMFKLIVGDQSILITGHIYPELSESQLERIGTIDVLIVPVGGNGYTVDPVGALKLIKNIEPKIIIPTHYADSSLNYPVPQQEITNALKELSMEPKQSLSKFKLKPTDLSDVTQLVILEKI